MELEKRNTKEYIDAYAEYVKRGSMEGLTAEQRGLLTDNATNGTVATPDVVADIIKTNWEKSGIISRCLKVSAKGQYKQNFERSCADAINHVEGAADIVDGSPLLGIATITPTTIAKMVGFSRESMKMRGEAFLRYAYNLVYHKIVMGAAHNLTAACIALPQTSTDTSPSADKVSLNPALGTIAEALGHLNAEATKPVVVMNRLTYSDFKRAYYAGNFAADPFEGLEVEYDNSLPAFSAASTGNVYAYIADFGLGGVVAADDEGLTVLFDEISQKTKGMVEVSGDELVGTGIVADKAVVLLAKAAA